MTEPLLLAQSYGGGTGDTISLRGAPHPRLEEVLLDYSCHPPALPKIRQCLHYSRRYDCEVQPLFLRNQHSQLERDLAEIGIELVVMRLSDLCGKPLR